MMIAIHGKRGGFTDRWKAYCERTGAPYKWVNCYQTDIVAQVKDCSALLWHFHQCDPRDMLFAKQFRFVIKNAGKRVIPDFRTMWHFDEKVQQSTLIQAHDSRPELG